MAPLPPTSLTTKSVHDISEAARAKFRDAIRPIYGINDKGDPDHIGSSILIFLDGKHYLLTAAHVIDHNQRTSLYLGADGFTELEFEVLMTSKPEDDRTKDHNDFAIAELNHTYVSKLSTAKFITENEINFSDDASESRLYACIGFPNSKNKISRHKTTSIIPKIGLYSGIGKPTSILHNIANVDDHILVGHNSKRSRDGESGKIVNSIGLSGFSGGAIIDIGPKTAAASSSDVTFGPKLTALLIEKHDAEGVILGTRLTTICRTMQPAQQAPAADSATAEPA
ncbi:hypothetical protein [Nitrospirillum pindoramense]|uniref:Trypsin-like peptidase n=1 Tax=Nitrospirillum amazonense TaxID=28077 RepID=A0A560HKC9_9PROT|nr:hypothetical protein [Nitrospirillum amazonense]TWB45814.1 hypothetical protein FBZ90_101149 [Nitrospirillum amazonense]